MGRKKQEETKSRPIRMPIRLWNLVNDIGYSEKRTLNHQVWYIVEDWLQTQGYLKEVERRR